MLYRNQNQLTWSICNHMGKPYKHNIEGKKTSWEWHIQFDIIYIDLKNIPNSTK